MKKSIVKFITWLNNNRKRYVLIVKTYSIKIQEWAFKNIWIVLLCFFGLSFFLILIVITLYPFYAISIFTLLSKIWEFFANRYQNKLESLYTFFKRYISVIEGVLNWVIHAGLNPVILNQVWQFYEISKPHLEKGYSFFKIMHKFYREYRLIRWLIWGVPLMNILLIISIIIDKVFPGYLDIQLKVLISYLPEKLSFDTILHALIFKDFLPEDLRSFFTILLTKLNIFKSGLKRLIILIIYLEFFNLNVLFLFLLFTYSPYFKGLPWQIFLPFVLVFFVLCWLVLVSAF